MKTTNLKTLFTAFVLTFSLSSGASYADDGITKEKKEAVTTKTPEQAAQLITGQLEQDIVLSAQQKTALSQATLEWAQKRQQINTTMEAWSKEHIAALDSVDTAYEEVLKSELSLEQQEQLTAKREQRKEELRQLMRQTIEQKNQSK